MSSERNTMSLSMLLFCLPFLWCCVDFELCIVIHVLYTWLASFSGHSQFSVLHTEKLESLVCNFIMKTHRKCGQCQSDLQGDDRRRLQPKVHVHVMRNHLFLLYMSLSSDTNEGHTHISNSWSVSSTHAQSLLVLLCMYNFAYEALSVKHWVAWGRGYYLIRCTLMF